ncbi:hypothetical protein [Lutimonas zeaxanthinifaciens]|uniref:hypothetical protein n=1 Tax=Lutimonas zeaxanthinifaciens TaxID=3060215 RepID=UPI00265D1286|nr:hypothetical protein [Lutimonas sp. YSD2104]WKK67517.1 hypothetical protein QZH61_07780 [Lutimonas sp. YSD2104]
MKRQINLVVLIMLILLSSNSLKAQTTTDEIIDEYFKLYEKSPEEAFDFLSKDIKVIRGQETTENLKKQILFAANQSGVYYGYEKIIEKSLGNSLKLLSFLIKYEKEVVRLTTILYKPADKWKVIEYHFDVSLLKELKESANLNSLQ